MKYLKLIFKDAGFFETDNNQNVSISVNQISNMLHVLMNERPVATYRKTIFKVIPDIFEIANKSLILIDTPMVPCGAVGSSKTAFKGRNYYNREFMQTNKNAWDSYRDKGSSFMDWKILSEFLGEELFNEMIQIFNHLLKCDVSKRIAMDVINNIIELQSSSETIINVNKSSETQSKDNKVTFLNLIKMIDDSSEFNVFCKKLIKNGKTPIVKLLFGIVSDSAISKGKNLKTTVTNVRGIESNLRRISGSIIVPVNDWAINKIKNSKGVAKLLDGGCVFIDELLDSDYIGEDELSNYININKLQDYENKN